MRQLLIQVMIYNFQFIEQTIATKLADVAEIIESFFVLNAQLAKKIPQVFGFDEINCERLLSIGMLSTPMLLVEIS